MASTLWENMCYDWDKFCYYWEQCEIILDESFSGRKDYSEEDFYLRFKELDKEKKKVLIKVIVWLKGERYEEEKYIEDYKVTVDDIKLLLREYKIKKEEKIKIKISDVNVS